MRRASSGFTLVELLVVITIIGILISLLLPAVQAAREAARRAQCSNHLKQLGLGVLLHEQAIGHFPTGGWGSGWHGDPDQGFGPDQPGSWLFTVLPYVEQQGLFDMGGGQPGWPVPAAKKTIMAERNRVPLALFHCPTRRRAVCTPMGGGGVSSGSGPGGTRGYFNVDRTPVINRNDYAMNAGTNHAAWSGYGYINTTYTTVEDNLFPPASRWDGLSFPRSRISLNDVPDGATNTYLVGEKYMCPDRYYDGLTPGDDEGAFNGINADQYRWGNASLPPLQDRPGADYYWSWGSAHSGIFNMALCDGSVRPVSYSIDLTIHELLCNRKDRKPIDSSKF